MSRLQHPFDDTETVGCDNGPCGQTTPVATGAIAPGWYRGHAANLPGDLDACGALCCSLVNRQLSITMEDAPVTIEWTGADGRTTTTSVGQLGASPKGL